MERKEIVRRFTVHDTEKTVSFLSDTESVPCLVAACTAGPAHFEALLLDADGYQPGLAASVGGALLAADADPPPDQSHHGGEPFTIIAAFEVRDTRTALAAAQPDSEGIVTIDLVARRIGGWIQTDPPPKASGMLIARDLDGQERTIFYALDAEWRVDVAASDHVREEKHA